MFTTGTAKVDIRLPGQWYQAEAAGSGLNQNHHRDYDPSLGRYIQVDPLGIDAGQNPYAYVDGMPYDYVDPLGLQPSSSGRPPTVYIPYGARTPAGQAFGQQIAYWNQRTRELNPRSNGYTYVGEPNAAAASAARNLFARTQAAWAATRGVCLGTNQPGVNYRAPGPTIDRNTGWIVGLFYSNNGNNMISPQGGRASLRPNGVDYHTYYPNGSNYQRYNPQGHGLDLRPHGHGHLPGTGTGMNGQGQSISPTGQPVPPNSASAHWYDVR